MSGKVVCDPRALVALRIVGSAHMFYGSLMPKTAGTANIRGTTLTARNTVHDMFGHAVLRVANGTIALCAGGGMMILFENVA